MRRMLAATLLLLALLPGCDGGSPAEADAADDGAGWDDGGADSDADADAEVDGDAADGDAAVPDLRPVTAARAEDLGAWARRLRTVSAGVGPLPMAWSMVNVSCQDRAMALAYALAAAPEPLGTEPPPMTDVELTPARVGELAASPGVDVAMINVTGPLVAFQTLLRPDGTPLAGDPQQLFWAYHHGVALNVDGEIRVLDLSVGDAPIPVADWVRSFVAPPVTCELVDGAAWIETWSYWLSAFSSLDPGPRPARLCAYSLTPIFTFRWDQTPADLADFIASTPATMQVQFEGFKTILSSDYGVTLPDDQLPLMRSAYAAGTEADVCSWVDLRYCAGL